MFDILLIAPSECLICIQRKTITVLKLKMWCKYLVKTSLNILSLYIFSLPFISLIGNKLSVFPNIFKHTAGYIQTPQKSNREFNFTSSVLHSFDNDTKCHFPVILDCIKPTAEWRACMSKCECNCQWTQRTFIYIQANTHAHINKKHIQSVSIHSRVWPDQDFWSQCHIWNPTKQLQLVLLFGGMFHFLLNNSSICYPLLSNKTNKTILTLFDLEFLWTKSSIKLIFWFLVENISLSQHGMKIPPIHIYFLNPCHRYWEQFMCAFIYLFFLHFF